MSAGLSRTRQGAGPRACSRFQLPESCPLGLKFGSSLMMYSLESIRPRVIVTNVCQLT
jgi:hypothetical protein